MGDVALVGDGNPATGERVDGGAAGDGRSAGGDDGQTGGDGDGQGGDGQGGDGDAPPASGGANGSGGGRDGGTPPTSDVDSGHEPPAHVPAGVVFSELMAMPNGGSDNEWIELFNASDAAVDLTGCTVSDGEAVPSSFTIDVALRVEKGGYAVLARDMAETGSGVKPDFVYGAFYMNSSGTLTLECGGTMIDQVEFTSAPYKASLQLDARYVTLGKNDDAADWCAGTSAMSVGENLGTPGATNIECASVTAP